MELYRKCRYSREKEEPIFIKDGLETEFTDIKPFIIEPGITYVPASCCNKIFNSGFHMK